MSVIAIITFSFFALLIAFSMAAGHKDFQESMFGNMVWLFFDLLLWAGAVGLWLDRMRESKQKSDTDADAKFYHKLGFIFGAVLFFVCIAFSILLFIPRILKSDTLF
jgi:cytochrome bd-type quinol oxidase subunit 2